MKAAAILLALALCACETIENEDGTTVTRFDAKAATDAINTGFSAYDRYRSYQQPVTYPTQPPAYYQPYPY